MNHHPYLGVELADDLNWGHHIKNIVPKAQRTLNLLRRNLSGCSKETKDIAYRTLIRPGLEFASAAWDPYQANHIEQLEKVQRRAARFVMNRHSRQDSVTDMMTELGWRTLQERRIASRLSMLYKSINGLAVCDLPRDVRMSAGRTRASHALQFTIPSSHTDTYKFSYYPRTLRTWNLLPSHIVAAVSVDIFKAAIQKQFESNNMYAVPPRGQLNRPRLGSSIAVQTIGPVY